MIFNPSNPNWRENLILAINEIEEMGCQGQIHGTEGSHSQCKDDPFHRICAYCILVSKGII